MGRVGENWLREGENGSEEREGLFGAILGYLNYFFNCFFFFAFIFFRNNRREGESPARISRGPRKSNISQDIRQIYGKSSDIWRGWAVPRERRNFGDKSG